MSLDRQLIDLIMGMRPPAWAFALIFGPHALLAVVRALCMIWSTRRAVREDDPKGGDRALKILEWLLRRRDPPK